MTPRTTALWPSIVRVSIAFIIAYLAFGAMFVAPYFLKSVLP